MFSAPLGAAQDLKTAIEGGHKVAVRRFAIFFFFIFGKLTERANVGQRNLTRVQGPLPNH